jgi:hypothetical protein
MLIERRKNYENQNKEKLMRFKIEIDGHMSPIKN